MAMVCFDLFLFDYNTTWVKLSSFLYRNKLKVNYEVISNSVYLSITDSKDEVASPVGRRDSTHTVF